MTGPLVVLGLTIGIFFLVRFIVSHRKNSPSSNTARAARTVSVFTTMKKARIGGRKLAWGSILILLVWFFWGPIKTKYLSLMEWRARDFKSTPSNTATARKKPASLPCRYYLLGVDSWYAKGDVFDAAYLETGGDIWGKFRIVSSKYGTTSTLEWNGTGGTYRHSHPHETTYAVTLDTMDPKLKVWTGFIGAGNPGALSCGESDCWRFRITCDPS